MDPEKTLRQRLQAFLAKFFWVIVGLAAAFILGLCTMQRAKAAFPVDVQFIWSDPVQYEDGTALDPDIDLVQYEVFCDRSGVEVFRQTWPKEVGVTEKGFAGAFDGAGTYICQLRTQATNGGWSAYSDPKDKKVTGNPNSPVIIRFDAARQP